MEQNVYAKQEIIPAELDSLELVGAPAAFKVVGVDDVVDNEDEEVAASATNEVPVPFEWLARFLVWRISIRRGSSASSSRVAPLNLK